MEGYLKMLCVPRENVNFYNRAIYWRIKKKQNKNKGQISVFMFWEEAKDKR